MTKKNTHGGKREGAGRKSNGKILKIVRLPFESEEEYKEYMKTPPRERVTIIINQ